MTFTAEVTPVGPGVNIATGTVTFSDGASVLSTVSLNDSARAIFKITSLLVGNHSIAAVYSGDAKFNPSSSAVIVQKVLPDSTTTSAISTDPLIYSDAGQNVALQVNVTSVLATVNEGNVTITVKDGNGNGVGSPVTVAVNSGVVNAAYSLPGGLKVGTYYISAAYSGGPEFNASNTTAPASLVVNKAATAMTVTYSNFANTLAVQNVTLTAKITTANGSVVNQGIVTFVPQLPNIPKLSATVTTGSASVVENLAGGSGGYLFNIHYSGGDNFLSADVTISIMPQ